MQTRIVNVASHSQLTVKKRGDRGYEPIKFDKITDRIDRLCANLDKSVDSAKVAMATIKNLYDGISTEDLDKISADVSEGFKLIHPDYSILSARILISNLHKTTPPTFSAAVERVQAECNQFNLTSYDFIMRYKAELDSMINDHADYQFDYMGYKTLESTYLIKIQQIQYDSNLQSIIIDEDDTIVDRADIHLSPLGIPMMTATNVALRYKMADVIYDRPQYMFMRVAVAIYHGESLLNNTPIEETLNSIKQCYDYMADMLFVHATPTQFNSCKKTQQLNSCFLLGTADNTDAIMDGLKDTAKISKNSGGIGVQLHDIRPRTSRLQSTGGKASGIIKQIKMYEAVANTFDQGGRRPGAVAMYLELWHGDIMRFLAMKLPQGDEGERARNLFYAVWINDLFMERFINGAVWSLFDANTAPGLSDLYDGMQVCKQCNWCSNSAWSKYYGEVTDTACTNHTWEPRNAFTELYTKYEREGKSIRVLPAANIVNAICEAQRLTGTPYVCFKDHANRMSNQANIGTIKCSNLCVAPETKIFTDQGYIPIKDLAGRHDVNVWNGQGWSLTRPTLTGVNQRVINISFSNGLSLDCTEYHKFYVIRDNNVTKVDAIDLTIGDQLIPNELPADPVENCKLLLLSEYFEDPQPTTNYNEVVTVLLLLQTIGLSSRIACNIGPSRAYYKLVLSDHAAKVLENLGIRTDKIDIEVLPENTGPVVTGITDIGRRCDTYCFTERGRGMGMFNGVLTGNCTEIYEYSTDESYACCTLASINLKKFIRDGAIDHEKLHNVVRFIAKNLDIIIDINDYPVEECTKNAKSYRPIGMGIQGLANVFAQLRIPFLSKEAERIDLEIIETIYHAALTESCERAKKYGAYSMFEGSPASQGNLHFDLWRENQIRIDGKLKNHTLHSGRYDWEVTRANIMKYGLRQSLHIAPMPTVSTSQLLGNNESFEPFEKNIYTKTTQSGKTTMINTNMIEHFIELGIWNETLKNRIINNPEGSIAGFEDIPEGIRDIYITTAEMRQTDLMTRTALRQAYVDQGQSLNIYLRSNTNAILRGVLKTGWNLGLKTGSYYIRTRAAVAPLKNNIAISRIQENTRVGNTTDPVCMMEEGCLYCSS